MVEVLRRWGSLENPRAYARRAAIHNLFRTRQRGLQRIRDRLIERGDVPQQGDVDPGLLVWEQREWVTLLLKAAWNQIVERYAPLVYTICQRYRLAGHDIEDVGQRVWLLLVENIGRLREPAALPGWLATTTARECVRVLRSAQPDPPPENWARLADDTAIDAEIRATERNAALHKALTALPPSCQELLALLMNDPPLSYAEIAARLGIPVGSIGPQRRRCLQQLRRSIPPAALRGVREFNPGPPSAPRRPPLPE
jgi:RNA polymerase sigma factor (sigma-70 family)